MESIEPSHYPATRAAVVAGNCINVKLGGPYRFFVRETVTAASKETIAGEGNKYHLTLSVKDSLNEQPEIPCTAKILHYTDKKTPPDVTFTLQTEPQNYTAGEDLEFYNRMMNMKVPLEAEDIPDAHGEIAPDMKPVFYLAMAAASFVKWKHSTEETNFAMTMVKCVKLLKIKDLLACRFTLLIHDIVSQEIIPFQVEGTWSPSAGLQIENHKQLAENYRAEY